LGPRPVRVYRGSSYAWGLGQSIADLSKGEPKPDPKPPGRKAGKEHGPAAFRKPPPKIDEVIDVAMPDECPDCRVPLEEERIAYQYQTEIPRVEPWRRRFDVHIGRCPCCRRRHQGRHPLQTSDALGAAASQLGPNALALAAHLSKVCGLPYRKIAAFLKAAFGVVASAGGLSRAREDREKTRADLRVAPREGEGLASGLPRRDLRARRSVSRAARRPSVTRSVWPVPVSPVSALWSMRRSA
jgi:hypothetical protein